MFICSKQSDLAELTSHWKSPSNIALVKYWGKKDVQIPMNPSISFTLSECHTDTLVTATKDSGTPRFEVYFEDEIRADFVPKIESFWQRIKGDLPELNDYRFRIDTSNTFPHSSGIASSASGMSALALCFAELAAKISGNERTVSEISRMARLGSGSAARSVSGPVMMWGAHPDFSGSSDEYAIDVPNIDPVFSTYRDCILIVHEGKKEVSSTVGHGMLKGHPFAELRYRVAAERMTDIQKIMRDGDLTKFVDVVEGEALMLHALMMTSSPGFILMKPRTLSVIEKIRSYRKMTGVPVCFTLDAGANVHMLYPDSFQSEIMDFVNSELKQFCADGYYICDKVGPGPSRID